MMKCFECGSVESIHKHHVVPKSKGGKNTIPLCEKCHGKVHNIIYHDHKEMVMLGLKKARDRGVIGGRPKIIKHPDIFKNITTLPHYTITEKVKLLGISRATYYRELKLLK